MTRPNDRTAEFPGSAVQPRPSDAPVANGRGTQTPAGGEPASRVRAVADSAPLAGLRTFTIAMPPGLQLLSLNDRLHWRERYSRAQVLKDAALTMARYCNVPRLERVSVTVEYQPPDRRHRDADNPIAAAKACIDGIVLAGCIPDDECPRYVAGIWCTIGEIYPRGRLVLHLTEVEALAELGGAA